MTHRDANPKPSSAIQGDRLCVSCAYNLRGQPVVQEPHYGLFLVRCPECGTPAAVQEYPLLGRWPGRIRVFVALSYLLVCIFAVSITAAPLGGMAAALADVSSDTLAGEIAARWTEHAASEEAAGRDPFRGTNFGVQRDAEGRPMPSRWTQVRVAWWASERGSIVARAGVSTVLRVTAPALPLVALAAFAIGCVWAVLLLWASRRVLFAAALVPLALAVLVMLIDGSLDAPTRGWMNANDLAWRELTVDAFIVVLVLWFTAGGLGLITGRPLARLGVRALLPPTMRGALAELWFTDNKPLPTGTRAPRTLYPETTAPAAPGEQPDEHV